MGQRDGTTTTTRTLRESEFASHEDSDRGIASPPIVLDKPVP